VVLAAGVGSRYGGAKQLDPVGPRGEILSDYAVRDAAQAGAGLAVFVVRPELEEPFREHHAERGVPLPVAWVHQRLPAGRARPRGTTEATVLGAERAGGPVVVVNADDYYGREAIPAAGRWLAGHDGAANVAFTLRETLSPHGGVSRAILEHDGGRLTRIVELANVRADHPGLSGDEPVSMNCWAFGAGAVPLLRGRFEAFLADHGDSIDAECRLPDTVMELVTAGRLDVTVLPEGRGWLGLTHAADREAVQTLLRERDACN
jgi:hypothetical protein